MRRAKTAFLVAIWVAAAIGITGARAAETDALAISSNIQARHLPFGTILDPILASATSDQIVGYTRCGDSAIWTGHYLAAEAFRYQVTRAPEALDRVRNAMAGIASLVDATGTDLLARCRVPIDSPFAAGIRNEEAPNGIHTNAQGGYFWVGNTSRDQYCGAIFGLAVAYDMVDDAGLRSSISQLVTRLIDFLADHAWLVVMPDGAVSTVFLQRPDQILSFLQVARHVNPGHFSAAYDQQNALLAAAVLLPIGIDAASDDSYFKFNLDYIDFYNLIRLDGGSASNYRKAYKLLRSHTTGHQNAFFNVIDRAINGPDPVRDAETLALLGAWLARSRRDNKVDQHGVVAVCGDQACRPVPAPLRPPTDFLWQRNPFQLAGGGDGLVESAGIDYILPYWMARYYSVASPYSVQSAASSIVTVAPGSIATIYGSSLAPAALQSVGRPLPESLAGVRVAVRDAAGAERPAPLYYVSPGQINFVVPESTETGLAIFTVSRGGAAAVSAPGTVLPVAPTLFSANGTGAGVAAAIAMRMRADDPAVQSPVPVFECSGLLGCEATPIDLGIYTPVYLSLFGTGIRNRSSLSRVTVTIDRVSVPVLYAGPQPQFDGLDQVNVALPLSLRSSGETNIVLTVDEQTANPVTVSVR